MNASETFAKTFNNYGISNTPDSMLLALLWGPSEDAPFALIIWYIAKTVPIM